MNDLNLTRVSEALTPKERVLLLVRDDVEKEKTGKGTLTDAEKHTLSQGWQPTTNEQAKEYNRYNRGWQIAGCAQLDAQTAFLNMEVTYFQEKQAGNFLLMYPIVREAKRWADRLDTIKMVNVDQALAIVKKQREVKIKEGLDYDYAVYQLAFESLSPDLQKDLEILYEEVAYEHQYLDQEEVIANLFGGKDELTDGDKEKLAGLIVKSGYNDFAKEWQFWHYFGSIPLKEIGKRWLIKRGIKPEVPPETEFTEAMAKAAEVKRLSPEQALEEYAGENIAEWVAAYANDHKTTIEAELKAVALEWLNQGLLEQYEPLFKSKDHKTYNGITKRPHDELYKEWIRAKAKARETVDRLVKEGRLKKESNILTGESIYSFDGDHQFIKREKEHIDTYDANLGIVYADDDPEHKGEHLDRELLITDVDKSGKPYGINFSQVAIKHLRSYFDAVGIVKETEVNGERLIEFSEEHFNELVRNTTAGLNKDYATLLAFKDIFDRLSKTYGVDVAYKIDGWLKVAERFINSHNETLEFAIKKDFEEMHTRKVVKFKDDLFIRKEEIKSDFSGTVGEYIKELEETLGEGFSPNLGSVSEVGVEKKLTDIEEEAKR